MAEGTLLLLAFAVVFTGIICAVGVTLFLSIYKELISLRKKVKSSWRKIDSILKQRQEELPRLLQLMKQCVGHKQVILEKVDHSRTRFESARRLEEKIKTSAIEEIKETVAEQIAAKKGKARKEGEHTAKDIYVLKGLLYI